MARIAKRRMAAAGMIAAVFLTGGCSIFHENVKGGFTCQAPKGVCAPSSTIDDAALAQIGGNHGGDLLPASAEAMAMEDGAPTRHHARRPAAPAPAKLAMDGRPALRVVHPAWIDSQGGRHERTTDYTYVDAAPGLAYDTPAVGVAALDGASGDRSLLGVALRAPEAGVPVAAAMALTTGADPNLVIRAKVSAILAQAPKPMVAVPVLVQRAPPPGTVEPLDSTMTMAPAHSAGVFPPAGS